MDSLTQSFDDRLQEIDAYLDLLDALERQVTHGPPEIGGAPITTQQQKILYSAVYLQLYNLVEATVSWCIDAVTAAASAGWKPADLAPELRREWVRHTARTHIDLNQDNRLIQASTICDHLIQLLPVDSWSIEAGGGGNWDDFQIEAITKRIGCRLHFTPSVLTGVKRKLRDDKGPLELVKDLRNQLAHGSISFTECGDGITVVDLRAIRNQAADYLREVLDGFKLYIAGRYFLHPGCRPPASPPVIPVGATS